MADIFDTIDDINQAAREFGRDPIVLNTIGIRGGRVTPRPRATGNTKRTRQAPPVECDDYPCAAEKSETVSSSGSSNKSSKKSKSPKSSKKNSKKDKTETKKDTNKLAKKDGDRRLSPLYDTFGREEVDDEERYAYGLRK